MCSTVILTDAGGKSRDAQAFPPYIFFMHILYYYFNKSKPIKQRDAVDIFSIPNPQTIYRSALVTKRKSKTQSCDKNKAISIVINSRTSGLVLLLNVRKVSFVMSRESNQCAITSSLRSYRQSVDHSKMGVSRYVPIPKAQQTCRLVLHIVPLMLSVKQGSCEYQFQSHWCDPTRNQTQVYSSKSECFYHSAN